MNVGTIVKCRNREWVLLPSDNPDVYLLRPLAGSPDEVVAIHKQLTNLIGYDIPSERVTPASFPLPNPDDVKDARSCFLFWQATRLSLREGAAPFRSLGRISIRPRIYQFVPLLMALRLDPIRVFIADDVGVGKTIEALLVARELWDRGEIKSFSVLCPPYLCEQWEKEIKEKFNLEPTVIRSGTISQLEKKVPPGKTIYQQFPIHVISIDWVKSDKNKHQFLQFCPELVIVDEVHGAAEAANNMNQQQRHELLKEIALKTPPRHMIFLTATPHSGIPEAFKSLLTLLNPEFNDINLSGLSEREREKLARHFVQRTRKDIEKSWEEAERIFPERVTSDETYELSPEYLELFKKTYDFCFEIVSSAEVITKTIRRMRYWGALALLRCVMSSPKAAEAAFSARLKRDDLNEEGGYYEKFVYEPTVESPDDENPLPPIEDAEGTLNDNEKSKLVKLRKLANEILNTGKDKKLSRCIEIVKDLLKEKYNPIIWCRYVATAEYLGEHLKNILGDKIQVVTLHGRIPDDERKAKIDDISFDEPRVLVATDCLSEGVNLQEKFTAVIHYDLPWNPNRLEQREGRVDRYGQKDPKVKAVRFYGKNNPVDGAIIQVLLDKAKEIRKTLGTYVPVPEENESLMEALINALFFKRRMTAAIEQLELGLDIPEVIEFQKKWEIDSRREQENRTRFAQKAIKLEEVKRELELTDSVLGDPETVKSFVLSMLEKIGIQFIKNDQVYSLNLISADQNNIPELIKRNLPRSKSKYWKISFISPTPAGAEYIGRNHPFVSALAQYAMEEALRSSPDSEQNHKLVSRCGAIRTSWVNRLTTLLLLRIRYLIKIPEKDPLLAEEVQVAGYYKAQGGKIEWLTKEEALSLLEKAAPAENIPLGEKKELIFIALDDLRNWSAESANWGKNDPITEDILNQINNRALELKDSQKRIRLAVHLKVRDLNVEPQLPPDLLGILVLQPVVTR
jgi:superfamily II DNA or RNA helicase